MKFLVFSGTTEGKLLWEYLHRAGATSSIFVATEYGAEVMPPEAAKDVFIGRLNQCGMADLFSKEKSEGEVVVIDATHPYAVEVSKNLREASFEAGIGYYRFLRSSTIKEGVAVFDGAEAVAEYLSTVEGNILLATGSKDLEIFTKINNYSSRVYPRILPISGAVEKCLALGYKTQNIICMQGAFSTEMNVATINMIHAKYIVTKDTGCSGGFDEKIKAAEMTGAEAVIIKRPEEAGLTFDELKKLLRDKFGIKEKAIPNKHEEIIEGNAESSRLPLFFDFMGRKTLVVGGGKVAERRVKILLNHGANITVVTKQASDFIEKNAKEGNLTLILDTFDEKYVDMSYFIAIAATDDEKINTEAVNAARACGVLANMASDKNMSDFFFPAVVSGGGITGGIISTSGCDHKLTARTAKKLRAFLADIK